MGDDNRELIAQLEADKAVAQDRAAKAEGDLLSVRGDLQELDERTSKAIETLARLQARWVGKDGIKVDGFTISTDRQWLADQILNQLPIPGEQYAANVIENGVARVKNFVIQQ